VSQGNLKNAAVLSSLFCKQILYPNGFTITVIFGVNGLHSCYITIGGLHNFRHR